MASSRLQPTPALFACPPPPPPAAAGLFRRRLFFELAPAVQFAHDLGDVHRVGCFSSLGFFFQLPQDHGARAGAQVAPHEREARAGRQDGAAVGGKPPSWPSRDAAAPSGRRSRRTRIWACSPMFPVSPKVGGTSGACSTLALSPPWEEEPVSASCHRVSGWAQGGLPAVAMTYLLECLEINVPA